MEINPDAPGNISQKGETGAVDNETGFGPHSHDSPKEGGQSRQAPVAGAEQQGGVDKELGFDPESPDASDPAVDPLHPARTSNDPVPRGTTPIPDDEEPSAGGRGI